MDFPRHLKFSVVTTRKLINLNESGKVGSRMLYRRDVEFSKILAQKFGASYEILNSTDGQMGKPLPNGSWTGIIGMLQRGDTDIACTVIPYHEHIGKILDFTYPYDKSHVTFATRKLDFEPDPVVLVRPFSFKVWALTLLSFLLMMGAFYVVFSKRYSLKEIVLDVSGALLSQGNAIQSRNTSNSLLLMTWNVGAMLLEYSYCGVLLSFITFPPLTGVRTIPELAEAVSKGKYECTTYPGTTLIQTFASSSDSNFRIISRSLEKNKGSWSVQDVLENTISSKRQAYIGGENRLLPLVTKYFMSHDEFYPIWFVVWMRKGFCCKEHLSRIASVLSTSGMNKKILKDEIFILSLNAHSGDITESKTERKLSLVDLKGAFVILAAGNVLAILVFLLEIIYKKLVDKNCDYFAERQIKMKQNMQKDLKKSK